MIKLVYRYRSSNLEVMKKFSPLCLPNEICEIIFNYLSPEELLNLLLVNSHFKSFILEGKCADKLVLKINENAKLEDVIKSKRRITNIVVEKLQHENMIRIFKKFHKTVKKVEIKDCSLAAKEEIEKFSFELLRELTLSNISGRILYPMMKLQKKLAVLNIWNLRGGIETLINFGKIQENLKELNLYLNPSSNIFYQDISNILQFNLESITISFRSNFILDDCTLLNVENFLKSQGKTLKTIALINATNITSIFRVWNSLDKVEKLYFFSADFVQQDSSNFNLKVNERLKTFDVHVLGPVELKIVEIQPLLKATKNLESLGVWNLNHKIIEYSALHLPKLKSIKCATMNNDCKSFYDQLKTKKKVNAAIEIHQYL